MNSSLRQHAFSPSAIARTAVLAALLGCAATACDAGDSHAPGTSNGALALTISTSPSVRITTVLYSITGNGLSRSGSIDVSSSTRITGYLGGIPAGAGYQIALTATTLGDVIATCSGSAAFDIVAGTTSSAAVALRCNLPPRNGSVLVSGSVNLCPRVDALTVLPTEVLLGGAATLTAQAIDLDAGPGPLALTWSASGGALVVGGTGNASVTCTAPGPIDVTVTASDGDCSGALSATVTCLGGTVTPPSINVVINEVESNQGIPGDWVELYNPGPGAVDLSSWLFRDNEDGRAYVIPAGTVIPAGGYFVLEEAAFGFGLGANDSARLYRPDGTLHEGYTWTGHAATTYGRCPNGTGPFVVQASVTKGAANDCGATGTGGSGGSGTGGSGGSAMGGSGGSTLVNVTFNEVESSGGIPGDWAEIFNPGPAPADLSGWIFRDNDDTHTYVLPPGSIVPADGYLVLEEAAFGFGLGGNDSVRLFRPDGSLHDLYAWTTHAATTYGRCPNGTGPFVVQASVTKGAANDCGATGTGGSGAGGAGGIAAAPWPGTATVTVVSSSNQFGQNMSGLTYQPASGSDGPVLWAAQNGPPTLYALQWNGTIYAPYTAGGWPTGRGLRYANGLGNPDTEGVTKAAWELPFVYTATERNNDASTTSRNTILRYDTSTAGAELIATHEWLLNPDLPTVGANLGIEAITWVPDSYLVSVGFIDEWTGLPYDPARYPAHGDGVFIVGVEANGMLYVYVLDHTSGSFTRVATLSSGFPAVMGLEYDRELNVLWAYCDNTCGNRASVFAIDTVAGSSTQGRLTLRRIFDRPAGLPDTNNEGIAFAPLAECSGGLRPFIWSDDDQSGGFALRQGSVTCALPF